MAKQYTPKLKFQVVLELLQGEKTPAQVAKGYGIHPNTVTNWKQTFLDNGPELFAKHGVVAEAEINSFMNLHLSHVRHEASNPQYNALFEEEISKITQIQ